MKIALVVVGKLKSTELRVLCDDYQKRIRRYCELDERELRNDAAFLGALPKGYLLVGLQVHGRSLSSTEFAQKVQSWCTSGQGKVAFMIGGAEGLPRAVANRADFEISLSALTLPHRLARLVLYEQLYRAFSIWHNEPYARED